MTSEKTEADNLLDEMWNCELRIREKESKLEELKEDVKEIKAELKTEIQNLRKLSQAKHENRPLFPSGGMSVDPVVEPVKTIQQVSDGDQWAKQPIERLLEPPIPGMGQKKIDALIDEVETIGEFEKLRAEVGRDFEHLSKLLPKGFGEKLADELENRQLDFIANFSDEPVETADPKPAAVAVVDPAAIQKDEFEIRVEELATDDSGEWMDSFSDQEIWKNGFDAGTNGGELSDCCWAPGEKRDDWIRGFCSANAEEVFDYEETEEGVESSVDSEIESL
jgi:hypothetical protein